MYHLCVNCIFICVPMKKYTLYYSYTVPCRTVDAVQFTNVLCHFIDISVDHRFSKWVLLTKCNRKYQNEMAGRFISVGAASKTMFQRF